MEETTQRPKAPGLRWKSGKPFWRASKPAVAAGYVPKSVPLIQLANNEAALIERCNRLQKEMEIWLSGERDTNGARYDGTFGSLFDCWTTDEDSDYHKLKRQGKHGKHPYDSYIPRLKESIGRLRPERSDGRDLRRWFKAWSVDEKGKRRPAAARMALCVLKAALTYGQSLRMRGCADFKDVIRDMKFPGLHRRKSIAVAAQVIAVRKAAHELGHPRAALAYAIQFETTLRQYDVAGA